jgi:hypothetical protein
MNWSPLLRLYDLVKMPLCLEKHLAEAENVRSTKLESLDKKTITVPMTDR